MARRKPHILVAESEGFSLRAKAILEKIGKPKFGQFNRAALLLEVANVEVLWVRLRHRIDAGMMDRGRNLRCILSATTGLNHIDLAEAERRGIRVLSLRGETDFLKDVRATAEHTIGLMLALLRHLPEACEHTRSGRWKRDLFRGREICGSTVGIVGYGRLGRLVGNYLLGFGARVLATDPNVKQNETASGVKMVPLRDLLNESDLITLHVNLDESTQGFFGRKQFNQMRPGARLINTARGELIDENALLGALRRRRLAGAAVDVLSGESASGRGTHPLVKYARRNKNLLITPHIGGCTFESMEKTEIFLAEKLAGVFAANGVMK